MNTNSQQEESNITSRVAISFKNRNDSGNNNTHESNKKSSFKMGLFKIAEDDCANEYDDSDEEAKDIGKLQLKKPHLDKKASYPDEYSSSRERINGNIRMINTKADPFVKPKNNYNIPRGKDMLFSYNTQYGNGFGNFKNTKFAQYNHAYSRIQDTKKGQKKKQTASSLQRIEQSHLFGNISGYNKITSNISKNEIGSSIYDIDSSDICLGKKKSSAMEVMEFAKMFKNKGEESPSYTKGPIAELYNGRAKNTALPISSNNLEYRDLKNFNWIKDQLRDDSQKHHKYDRPCTRGGEKQGLDFSFIDKNNNQDLAGDASYFDRPVTRSKPRRPVSRQVRLSKKVNDSRGRGESESQRGMGELGE